MNMITAETNLVGVIGDPINHSLSPVIHNAALQELGLNWTYLAIPCIPKNLGLVLNCLKTIDCKGLNITIPHKSNAIEFSDKISDVAKEINAINTLIPLKEGGWLGDNTDVLGFVSALNHKKNWSDKNGLVLGCGGSAKAIICGLKQLNFKTISIINRNSISLNKFLDSIKKYSSKTKIDGFLSTDLQIKEIIKASNIIINTTPVGMSSTNLNDTYDSQIPLGNRIWESLSPGTILYDLIYNPRPTEWLKLGLKKDCEIIDGLEMLIQQGAQSLRLWSGIQEIPINTMREAAKSYLNKSKK